MDVLVGGLANTLERAPFARGGEGALYDFRWPGDRRAVKLYASEGGAERRRERAMYLVAHPPSRLRDTAGDAWELAWPERLVTHVDGRFAGVSMVRVRHAVRLSELTAHAHVLARRLGRRWLAYQLPTPLSLALRLQLAARVSQLVRAVHAEGRYVLTDLKPDNLLVTETGRMTLVDCDSVQVTEQGALRFASRVLTDDYTPPEGFDPAFVARWEGGAPLQTSWDGFSLSVIIYQLLLGIHPFAVRGRDTQRGVAVDTVRDAIRAGLYAHGPRRMGMLLIPPPHGGVASLPAVVRAALERSLAAGHDDPARRLSAQEWCDVLVPLTHRRRIWLGVRRRLAGDAARARDGAAFLWRGGTVALSHLESCRSTLARQFTRPLDIAKREVVAFLLGGSVVGLLLSFTVLSSPPSVSVLEQPVTVPLYPPFPVELMTPPVVAPDAPLVAPVADPFSERMTSKLVTGTVLTYARAGVLVRRDSVVTASDTAITMLRRVLSPTARGGGLEIVRYERTTDGVRLVTSSDTLLLLRAGARVGEGWWSFNGPSRLVTARSIGARTTMAGTIQGAELVTRELGARGERRHTIWLSARYGVVREMTTDAASDSAAEGSLELIAVMRPDALTGRGAERR